MASLAEIVKEIQSTNNLLLNSVDAQKRANQMEIDRQRDADAAKMDALQKTKGVATRGGSSPKGFLGGLKKGSGFSAMEGWGTELISRLFGGIAGVGLIGAITTGLGLILGKLLWTGALIGIVAKWGGTLIEKIFETLDPNGKFLDDATKKKLGISISRAAVLGLIAAVFGKKLGLAVFAGSLVVDAINNAFLSPESKKKMAKPIFDAFGIEFSKNSLASLGMGIAGVFGISAIMSAMNFALSGKAGKTTKGRVGRNSLGQFTKLKPGLLAGFRLGFGSRLGLAGGILLLGMAYGGVVSDAIGRLVNYGSGPDKPRFNDDVTKAMGDAGGVVLTATAMGFALGGPWGALVGAIIGGGIGVYKIMQAFQEKANEEALGKAMHAQRGFKEEFYALSVEDQEGDKGDKLKRKMRGVELEIRAQRLLRQNRLNPDDPDNESRAEYANMMQTEGTLLQRGGLAGLGAETDYLKEANKNNLKMLSGESNVNELNIIGAVSKKLRDGVVKDTRSYLELSNDALSSSSLATRTIEAALSQTTNNHNSIATIIAGGDGLNTVAPPVNGGDFSGRWLTW